MKCYKCGDLAWVRGEKQNSRMEAECESCRRPLCELHAKYPSWAGITNDGLPILSLYCNYCFNLFHEDSETIQELKERILKAITSEINSRQI